MAGKLIVLEGTDGSGKSTQKELLVSKLRACGREFKVATFPRYEHDSSALIKMYLNGEFGTSPEDVPAKVASVFFAVDRYASFKTDWGEYYKGGGVILCDRYTTSNAVHQTPKLDKNQWWNFTDWLFDFEYNLMGLPKPDKILFLDMPTEYALQLIRARQGDGGDIHELDHEYLSRCRECAIEMCKRYNWHRISCASVNALKSIEDIHIEIMDIVLKMLK